MFKSKSSNEGSARTNCFDTFDSTTNGTQIPKRQEPSSVYAPGDDPFDPFAMAEVDPSTFPAAQLDEALANDALWRAYESQPLVVIDYDKLR
ncbi:MAG TPA: hypothetical protein VMR34_01020 [Candidatus Saccharimonadales bacterium]|nr:hypothetical protein [Candidatus Saccharimonadales bacterium]